MSRINFLNNLASTKVNYNLGAGIPPLAMYPEIHLTECMEIFKQNFPTVDLLQYHQTEGLITEIAAETFLKNENIKVAPNQIMITNGVQEAIFLTLIAFKDQPIYCLDPYYPGLVDAAIALNCRLIFINEETKWEQIANIEKGALLYLSADFSNPTGQTLTLEERKKLVNFAEKNGWYIFDDATYREFYIDEKINTLYSLLSENVIHATSFSKLLAPGLRTGFVYFPAELKAKLTQIKSFNSLNNSGMTQSIIAGWLLKNEFDLTAQLSELKSRLLANKHIITTINPSYTGGFFTSFTLPNKEIDYNWCNQLLQTHSIAVCPMRMFSESSNYNDAMRLCIANIQPNDLQIVINTLESI